MALLWVYILIWGIFPWGASFISGETEKLTKVTTDGKYLTIQSSRDDQLWTLVNELKDKVDNLEKEGERQRSFTKELERQLIENQDDGLISMADIIQLKQTAAEMQIRITRMEENLDEQKLDLSRVDYEQKQLRNDLEPYKKLRENIRRSVRKLDKNLNKVTTKVTILSKQFQNLSESFFQLQHRHEKEVISLENKFENFEKLLNKSDILMSPGQLFNQIKSKLSKKSQNISNTISKQKTSAEIETDYIISPKEESRNIIETGSGDGSGEIPRERPGPHLHKNYVELSDFLVELSERDGEISNLYDIYYILHKQMSRVEDRLSSIQLGNFMEKLQNSLLNFTQNVFTLEQWRSMSSGIINSTQFNHQQITSLTNMILNNTNYLRDLEWKLTNVQSLGYQQFHLLRLHIIQLNNTVQDMKEEMNKWHRNGHGMPHQSSQVHTVTTTTNLDTIISRIEDLALQIVYNENRISKLEIKVLNESLLDCKKSNFDIYQDAKIVQLQKDVNKLIDGDLLAKNMISNLDQAYYSIHSTNINQSEIIATLIQDTKTLGKLLPMIVDIKREITNYQFQLPRDCDIYYHRGYTDDGVYVIYPYDANNSVRVYCDMEDGIGGWTILQRRINGILKFDRFWDEYANGFGSVNQDHWLGNNLIHLLTANKNMTLKIEMVDIRDRVWVGEYSIFKIGNEGEKFVLNIDGYHGNCSNGLQYSDGMSFSTQDRDNDGSTTHCAMYYTAGWWYKHCHYGNLNGRFNLGMVWFHKELNEWLQLKETIMKIRPLYSRN